MSIDLLTLKERLEYDAETGLFTWKDTCNNPRKCGEIAGSHDKHSTGYIQIQLNRKLYYAHRLAWFYTYGVWPLGVIDHINGNKIDNRLENLRDCDQSLNGLNKKSPRSNNTSGYLGVCLDKRRNVYKAEIKINGKSHFLGHFKDPEEASDVYQQYKAGIIKVMG